MAHEIEFLVKDLSESKKRELRERAKREGVKRTRFTITSHEEAALYIDRYGWVLGVEGI